MPRTEIEWSRRAIINVVAVLAAHSESLTLVGAHAVLLRTMDLDAPRMPTGDGDLGVTPGLVGDVPSIETLLAQAGYEHRTTARPGLWGRERYDEADGRRGFREKIDLLAPHGLSGASSRTRRGVPTLQPAHGKLAVGNAVGLELASFNRSPMTITDFADPELSVEIFVAGIPALILAKGSKIGERMRDPRKGPVRDKDFGDLWRLAAVAAADQTVREIARFVDHPQVGANVRQSVEWTADVVRDPVSAERAKVAFDTFVDPAEIDRVFSEWRDSF
ncbi:hypothetical protein [Gordonia sp. (in: high G+C Gram-positive bacteria)]|uniref:hypothetical protein n=1 Tax=Gordonia sp. (in: high G+C Gram-positive bacteria) TaxID=84139 RepID=UPI001DE19602|nr:hypothetical protein [Gordonia sp. (in: high G+C Gram-positive bacteria)]MCB1297161.1 hypothetical protein [Gordonia sp. (in: high G+C Gram-positive bacteria)]HMS75432.1 hypothetical protein [Gordonia sp. (in: high G+C Gram-positive bacteria)]